MTQSNAMQKLLLPLTSLSTNQRQRIGWTTLRLTLAGLVAAHGVARWTVGGVVPFGNWLDSQGWPFGLVIAISISAIEIVGPVLLVLGRCVTPLCMVFAGIYAMGIALVHAKAGWFVVGLGRNGSEYSVLLIVCLLVLALQHLPHRTDKEFP